MTGPTDPAGGTDLWPAPTSSSPLDAIVRVPGSKSQTARALYLAAVATGPTRLRGALRSRDTDLFAAALGTLGAEIAFDEGGDAVITPIPSAPATRVGAPLGVREIDCGLAGTVMRFLPPLAALTAVPVRFDGDAAARVRPLRPLLEALAALGAHIEYEGEAGFLPFTISGPLKAPASGVIEVDSASSSQFLSALLLVAPLLDKPVTVRPAGALVSVPHVRMTVEALRGRGVEVREDLGANGRPQWHITPTMPTGGAVTIEPDLSNAGPFLGAALLAGGSVTIPGWPEHTTQAGDAWRRILPLLGAQVTVRRTEDSVETALTVSAPSEGARPGVFDGLDIDMGEVGELVPTLAALLLFARSPSRIRGVAHLRGHETDRLAALTSEITRLGGLARRTEDGLVITPSRLHAADLRTYGDHRMATFAAMVGLLVPGVRVENIATTSKTLPDFPLMWIDMLQETR